MMKIMIKNINNINYNTNYDIVITIINVVVNSHI